MLKRFLPQSDFGRNVMTTMTGTAIAQVIPVACAPFLTRVFNPKEFGVFATFIAVTAFFNVILSGKYELAIILPKRDKEAINIVTLACTIASCVTVFTLLPLIISSKYLSALFQIPELAEYIWLIPVSAFLSTIYLIFNEWCIRKGNFFTLSKNKISNTASVAGSSVLFGLNAVPFGLILGQLAGQLLSSVLAMKRIIQEDRQLIPYISIRKMRLFFIRYRNFARYIIPAQLLNTLSGQLPIFFISHQFGASEVGLFALTDRVLAVPLTFLGNAFRDAFKQKAAADYNSMGNCHDVFRKTTLFLVKLTIIPFLILFIVAPFLFEKAFGGEWRQAGDYARMLMFMYMLSFISMPTSWMFVIAQKQGYDLAWQILFSLTTVASLVVGFVAKSVTVTLVSLCVGRSLAYMVQLYFSYQFAKGNEFKFD